MVKRLIAILFWMFPVVILAAPSISGISGTLVDGQTITVSGSGFGSTGPNIVIYDQFEGTNGASRSSTATIGTWSGGVTKPALMPYSTSYQKSGSTSMKVTMDTEPDWINPSAAVTFTGATRIFHSHWTYHPVNFLPRAWKILWITANWSSFSNSDWCINSNSEGFPADDWLAFRNDDNVRSVEYASTSLTQNKWVRIDVLINGATDSNGHFWGYETSSSGHSNNFDFTGTTLRSGSSWNAAAFPGYVDYDATGYYHADDVYIATGAGAACRIEIGNNATYASCTNLSICTVTSWSASSVQATLRQSDFANGTAYLFVVDADNVPSAGYQVTLGEEDATPPTVTSATINSAGTTLTLAMSESVTNNYTSTVPTLSMSGGAVAATCNSCSSGTSLTYTLSRTIDQTETGTYSWDVAANGVEDAAGNDLADISGSSVTNSSTQDTTPPSSPSISGGFTLMGGSVH